MTRNRTPEPRLTSRQAAEYLGITLDQWYYYGRTDVDRRPDRDGYLEGGTGDQPYWHPSTLDRWRAELGGRLGIRSPSVDRHRAVVAGMATPGLPDDAAGRAAVAADLGVHPRTVARHWTDHRSGKCLCPQG